MKWFVWWVRRPGIENDGEWYGPRQLTDLGAFQEQLAIRTGTSGVTGLYRWIWDGTASTWQYDTRPDSALLSSDLRFSWLDPSG